MSKRMLKDVRREQLLCIAIAIIKNSGSEALTLARVAEEAGVTKPVAYKHFKTKENLLKQIYQGIDSRVIESIQLAKKLNDQSVRGIISILCESYADCTQENGDIYGLTVAALKCYPNNTNISKEIQNFFVDAYADIFQLPNIQKNKLKLVAIHGIIEAICDLVATGEMPRNIAMPYLKDQVYKILVN